MHPDNDLYGHRAALNRYLRRPDATRMLAHIQHGWSWTSPVLDTRRVVQRYNLLAWSRRNAADLRALGLRRVTPVGAPFLYLGEDDGPILPSSRTLAFPAHSWRRGSFEDQTAGVRFADELAERYGPETTVCVHPSDLRFQEVIRRYEFHGFAIDVGAGSDGVSFLLDRRRMLRSAQRVVSNVVSTAVFYGGLLGCEIEVFGPVASVFGEDYAFRMERYQRARWPELTSGGLRGAAASDIAGVELGADQLRSPDELAQLAPRADSRASSMMFTLEYEVRRSRVVVSRNLRRTDPNREMASRALDRELCRIRRSAS